MLLTNLVGAACVVIGIAFIWLWFSELEAETLYVGNLLRLGQPEPRVSTLVVGLGACALGALIALLGHIRRDNE